ncbi:MAG: hypothetical protein LBR51_01465 [Bacteroidales bacterium]|jgi:hypothetical protein|nr:hypothetical protein [Bacteroidales bacterium]
MKRLKAIVKISAMLGIIVMMCIAIVKMQSRVCLDIEIKTPDKTMVSCVSPEEIRQKLAKEKLHVEGLNYKEIQAKWEQLLPVIKSHPYIASCDNFYFSGNKLVLEITPRSPLLHVYDETGEQYFLDRSGILLPYSPLVKENLIVALGHIAKQQEQLLTNAGDDSNSVLYVLRSIALAIEEDPFYAAQFRQIYVNSQGETELIPTIGVPKILFGNDENVAEKLALLKIIYTKAFPYTDMDKYAWLDVRFKNRIIAKKK